MLETIKNCIFCVRHLFKGFPVSMNGKPFRMDESLRRWNLAAEAPMQLEFEKWVRKGDCCVDIGANFGMHTLYLAHLVGDAGTVIAFEPVPRNLALLERNLKLNGYGQRTSVVPKLASNSPLPFLEMEIPAKGVAVTASMAGQKGGRECTSVPNTRLDDYFGMNSAPVRLMKIDVEGAELEVLRGAQEMLKRHNPALIIEVHGFALPDFGASVEMLRDFLSSLGYLESIIWVGSEPRGEYFQATYSKKHHEQ
jgi:FkbM family methyltransferase